MAQLPDLTEVATPSPADLFYTVAGGADGKTRACSIRSGLGVNVLSLAADPTAVTDWGPVLNAAAVAGVQRFRFPAGVYPFATPLDFDNLAGVALEGESGLRWIGDNWVGTNASARLVYKGSGSASAISATGTSGFIVRDLGVYYDNSAGDFTGKLIDLGGIAGAAELYRSHLGSLGNAFTTADCIVSFENAIVATISRCAIFGAQYLIRGNNVAHSNANTINDRTVLNNAGVAMLWAIWDSWTIDDCVIEVGDSPVVIDGPTGTSYGSNFTFTRNWIGDINGLNRPLFRQRANNAWNATFSGNVIRTPGGPIFELSGGGNIQIVDNPILQSNVLTDPVIDLGDTSDSAVAFSSVRIAGNQWTCTGADAVINRTGHRNLNIFGNAVGAGVLEERTFGGHERLGFPDRWAAPTITAGAGLGTGGTAALSDSSTDLSGQVVLSTGSGAAGGTIAKITFGTSMASDRDPAAYPHVILTPCGYVGGVDAGLYVDFGYTGPNGFWVAARNTPVGSISFFYRVIQS